MSAAKTYYVYILSNPNRTVLYTGVTNSLARRLTEHRAGTSGAFTSRYHATELLWFEAFGDVHDAIAREKQIKAWRRSWKWNLVRAVNPELSDRSGEVALL